MQEKEINNMNDINIYKLLKNEKDAQFKGGLYHITQIKLCYNSNRIEGNRLTEDQTRFIFETNTIATEKYKSANIDDIFEAVNHFACFDYMLDSAKKTLSENIIKDYHRILMNGTSQSKKEWFNVGEYKKLDNTVGDIETTSTKKVKKEMALLVAQYISKKKVSMNDIIEFHYNFEAIHPFQDGNGRVGRLIMFKECLKNKIIPFIIEDEFKTYYYRGLKEYKKTPGYLIDTCLHAQDNYKDSIGYFNNNITKIEKLGERTAVKRSRKNAKKE